VTERTRPWRVDDDFRDPTPAGAVVGSVAPDGTRRLGVDRERALSIDGDALRVRYLRDPGWGRAGISYGPFAPVDGLALRVSLLSGLTTSQTHRLPERRGEVFRRRFSQLLRLRPERVDLRDNHAIGWFAEPVPAAPLESGASFITSADPAAVGLLSAAFCGGVTPLVHGLQNLPFTFVVVLRPGGVAWYGSSVEGAHGVTGWPRMRPLWVEDWPPGGPPPELYAGVHVGVLGEVHYRVDTRVQSVQVTPVAALAGSCGSATVLDPMTGAGPLAASAAVAGGSWQVTHGSMERTSAGVVSSVPGSSGHLVSTEPVGLVRLRIETLAEPDGVSLRWRGDGSGRGWRLSVGTERSSLVCDDDRADVVAITDARLEPGRTHTLQVLDDGLDLSCYLDGRQLFGSQIRDRRSAAGRQVGVVLEGSGTRILGLECQPRTLPFPPELLPPPPWHPQPGVPRIVDDFTERGDDDGLAGSLTSSGGATWSRVLGTGSFDRQGDGQVRVRASRPSPNPGRTIYAVSWDDPGFAAAEVIVVPPGASRGEGHRGRSGLAFWQDEDNHLVLNHFIDDSSVGVSISAFLRIRGHERMHDYDAVWSNVGDRIDYGTPFLMRAAFDGEQFAVEVDGEPVLYRRLTDYRADAPPLRIAAVGLVANWEWGDDTGSSFRRFAVRGREL
jgi:hypothetical protein